MEAVVSRLEAAVGNLEAALGGAGGGGGGGADVPASVAAYDEIYDADVSSFIAAARAIGGDYVKIGDIAEKGFKALRVIILAATKCKKPADDALMSGLFAPCAAAIQEAQALPDNRNKAFNHQSAFVEFVNCLQWVFIAPAPKPFVTECKGAADFYMNKILTTFKDDPLKEHHRNFVKFIKSTIDNLADYIKKFHTTGLTWTASGIDISGFNPAEAGGSAPPVVPAAGGGSVEDRLAALADKVEKLSLKAAKHGGGEGKSDADEPPSIVDFDAIINGPVKDFVTSARKIGGEVGTLGDISDQAFSKLRWFIVAATKCAKPTDEELQGRFGEIAAVLGQVKTDNRSKAFNHQSAFQEHINIVQWVLIAPAPKPFAQSTVESADFYLNKVLSTTKDDPLKADHRAFVKAIKDITNETCEYIKKYHTTGLTWKNGGQKFSDYH